MRKWQITILVTVLFAIIGIAGAGWALRPIVDYNIVGAPDTINFDHGPLRISVRYRNRGETDTSLFLVVTTENAHISVDKIEPWIKYNETQVKFHVGAQSRMETYTSYFVEISLIENPQNFTVRYTIEDNSPSTTIAGIISHLFLEPHGYYPTHLVYNRTDIDTYELVIS